MKKKIVDSIVLSKSAIARLEKNAIAHFVELYADNPTRLVKAGMKYDIHAKITQLENLLNGTSLRRGAIKDLLIELKIKKPRCEGKGCKVGLRWHGKPIVLHLEHVDGNKRNNHLYNLKFLCPNCHSQTPTYCRTKKALAKKKRM